MDSFASIGRMFATPQAIIASLFGIAILISGIYLVATPPPKVQPLPTPPGIKPPPVTQPSSTGRIAGGVVMIILGAIIPYAAWWRRKYIRSNPGVAALFGVLDVESMIKFAIS